MSYCCLSDKAEVPVILSDPGSAWQEQEQDWIFGESLPTGLVLLATVEEQEAAAPNSPERPRQHQLRYYGAYAPRARSARRKRLAADSDPSPNQQSPRDDSPAARARRLPWAKLLRRVLEIEPLACPTCPGRLRILSFITDHAVVDHIITHLRRTRPGIFPPARGSPTSAPTETTICRADADGFIYAQDFPPDE